MPLYIEWQVLAPRFKLFSCSTELSRTFQLLIKIIIPTNKEVSGLKSLICCIYHANKCQNAKKRWNFNFYEQEKFSCTAEFSIKN